jgi:hypothetical protein
MFGSSPVLLAIKFKGRIILKPTAKQAGTLLEPHVQQDYPEDNTGRKIGRGPHRINFCRSHGVLSTKLLVRASRLELMEPVKLFRTATPHETEIPIGNSPRLEKE